MAWTLIGNGAVEGSNFANQYEWMVDSEGDVTGTNHPDDTGSPGSIAYLPGFAKMWQKNATGTWVQIGGENE